MIRNLDKRTARREYSSDFSRAIASFRENLVVKSTVAEQEVNALTHSHTKAESLRTVVYIRKRPIFPHELEDRDFDCITCIDDSNPSEGAKLDKKVIVHNCRMHADMLHQIIDHNEFHFNQVFDESASNEEVYRKVSPLVIGSLQRSDDANNDRISTIMMYGQTGSGKTFTMNSIIRQASIDLFRADSGCNNVRISFLELVGDACFDLLGSKEASSDKTSVQLLTDANGQVHWHPNNEVAASSAEELIALYERGCQARNVASTAMNDQSSRSHSIFKLIIADTEKELFFVDLAGSEMSGDSMHHDAARRKECKYINTSLMTLKECLHLRANASTNVMHTYRKNKLTMALKMSLTEPNANTVIICTVSPSSSNTEHTISTLRHACVMDGQLLGDEAESRFLTGGKVTSEQIGMVKLTKAGVSSKDAVISRDSDLYAEDKEIQRLEAAMKAPGVSSTTVFGLKKQLALRKAVLKKANPTSV